jgi:hypothetical protein
MSVAPVVAASPIAVGNNDARLLGGWYSGNYYAPATTIASSTTSSDAVATSTVIVDPTKNNFDLYLQVASTSQALRMYFNGAAGFGVNQYSNQYTVANGSINTIANGTTTTIVSGCAIPSAIWLHMTIDNSPGLYKKFTYQGVCSNSPTAQVNAQVFDGGGFRLSTTPITSISFTDRPDMTVYPAYGLSSTTIMVYQR